jgi:GNAT superfamily N-acetyltransferase
VTVTVRPLGPADIGSTSRLHLDVLSMEFLARLGVGFLRRYHRAWIGSPHAIALGARDEDGRVVGVLLGSLDPASHYRAMVRRQGVILALWLVTGALTHPAAARELLTTRTARYLRGVWRMAGNALGAGRRRRGGSAPPGHGGDGGGHRTKVGEVTHVMVKREAQSQGVGRALLEEARRRAEGAGLSELVLVTPPELTAGRFYERLGWEQTGELTSRSGERFVRYRLVLGR